MTHVKLIVVGGGPAGLAAAIAAVKNGIEPKDILVVDDMKLGWMMAQPVGVEIAFAAWSKADFPELEEEMKCLCDFSFNSPKELEHFLFEEVL